MWVVRLAARWAAAKAVLTVLRMAVHSGRTLVDEMAAPTAGPTAVPKAAHWVDGLAGPLESS
jgi:hypothetical protein